MAYICFRICTPVNFFLTYNGQLPLIKQSFRDVESRFTLLRSHSLTQNFGLQVFAEMRCQKLVLDTKSKSLRCMFASKFKNS